MIEQAKAVAQRLRDCDTFERGELENTIDALVAYIAEAQALIANLTEQRDIYRAENERLREVLKALLENGGDYTAKRDAARAALENKRCLLCNYQHGHAIGCENNPVDVALGDAAMKENKHD